MLSEFVVNDDKYKAYAYKICGCHELKNDLVNDMYIKLDAYLKKYPKKIISNSLIYLMIRGIFLNIVTRNREYPYESIPETIEDEEVLCERITIDEVLGEMRFFDREILLKTHETSLREVAKQVGCHHQTVNNLKQKALNKLKEKCQEKGLVIERVRA